MDNLNFKLSFNIIIWYVVGLPVQKTWISTWKSKSLLVQA